MSNRFNELARKAGATDLAGKKATKIYCLTSDEMDQFCALVMKECVEIINGDIYFQLGKGIRSNIFGLNQARDLITEHFNNPESNFIRHVE